MVELETERLTLNPHEASDWKDCAAMWSDASVVRFIGGKTFSRHEVWAKLLRYRGQWALSRLGYWVLREKATGRYVGEAGWADFKRELAPDLDAAPEVGWALATWAHGKGFATEAVRAAVSWMDATHKPPFTWCMIDPANTASIHVAQKCGYALREVLRFQGARTHIFRR